MKTKLFSILTLLLCVASGAWAQTTLSSSSFYQLYSVSNTTANDLITAASFPSYITTTINSNMNGKLASVPEISTPHDFTQLDTDTKYYRLKTGSSQTITVTNVANLKKVYFYGNGHSSTRKITTTVTKVSGDGTAFTVSEINMANSSATITEYSTVDFTKQTGYNASTYYTYSFSFSGNVSLFGVYFETGEGGSGSGKTALTAAWSSTSLTYAVDDTPNVPSFSVSGGSATKGTDYTVTYSEVSDDNNIVTTDASNGITAISTSATGTATIRATVALTETGAESYSLATTTYDITVSITSVATLFSMTDVTGPTTAIPHRDGEWDVEATFSAGGSATVYNGHSSSDAVMCDGYINVNGSGGSYLHIVFPTKLQIGDIISAEGTQKGADTGDISWRISATSSINNNSNNKTCPYTVTDGDGLAGATDLYIGKNSGAFIESITISGASDASDLTITSGKTVTIGTGSTSNIIYTSSNTTTPTFVSSATSVATVSDAGVITAVAPGTAVITITQASDGTIREAAAKVTVTVEKTQKATEVTGEFVLDTDNGTQSSGSYVSTDGSVSLEGGISNGSNTYNDLKNSHFKHSSNITFTLPSNYPVSTVWFVGYRNSASSTATIKLTKVDGASVTEQSGTVGGSDAIPAADWVGFELATAATKSMVINFSGECRGYFILNPDAQNIALTQIGTNYYASYYSAGEMTITGATAYTAELDAENSKLTLTACEGGVVPARTGVILIGNNASATATPSFTGATKEQGDLIGVAQKEVAMANYYVGSTSAAEKVFVLGAENSKAGLYKFTGTSLGVNKAYLYNETLASAGARSLSFDFADETTAINGISTDTVKDELRKFFDNGRLLIQKKGMKYNAAGQQMK